MGACWRSLWISSNPFTKQCNIKEKKWGEAEREKREEERENLYEKESSKNEWGWGAGLCPHLSSFRCFPVSGKQQRASDITELGNKKQPTKGSHPQGGITLAGGILEHHTNVRELWKLSPGVCAESLQRPRGVRRWQKMEQERNDLSNHNQGSQSPQTNRFQMNKAAPWDKPMRI